MNKINTLFAFALGFLVMLTSSCLDSSSGGSSYDGIEYVRLDPGSYLRAYADSGTEYSIMNPEKMRIKTIDGDNYEYERALMWFKYVEAGSTKTNGGLPARRTVNVVQVQPLAVNDLEYGPGDLNIEEENIYVPFIRVDKPWADTYYINIPFSTPSSKELSTEDITLFVEDSSENTLNLRLIDTREKKDLLLGQAINGFVSFKLDQDLLSLKTNLVLSGLITVNISVEEHHGGLRKLEPLEIKFN